MAVRAASPYPSPKLIVDKNDKALSFPSIFCSFAVTQSKFLRPKLFVSNGPV